MRRAIQMTLTGVAAGVLSACATMTVSSHVEPTVDLTQFYTYEWAPADRLPAGDPRLDDDPSFSDFVQGAIEKQLATKGFDRASSARPPDVLVHYHVNIARRMELTRTSSAPTHCYGDDCAGRVSDYDAGTLIIDVVDARTKRLIWRGWAQDSFDGLLDDRDRLRNKVDVAVRRILIQFQQPSELGGR